MEGRRNNEDVHGTRRRGRNEKVIVIAVSLVTSINEVMEKIEKEKCTQEDEDKRRESKLSKAKATALLELFVFLSKGMGVGYLFALLFFVCGQNPLFEILLTPES